MKKLASNGKGFKQWLTLLWIPWVLTSGPVEKAFNALEIYDYFRAKKYFTKAIKRFPVLGNYGLSIIHYRTDNPFHNLDTAYVRAGMALNHLQESKSKALKKMEKYNVNLSAIQEHRRKVETQARSLCADNPTISKWNHYILFYTDDPQLNSAIRARDSLAFEIAGAIGTSESYSDFMSRYPASYLRELAKARYEKSIYTEQTRNGSVEELEGFIITHPSSPHIQDASRRLFQKYTADSEDYHVYHEFIKRFPRNPFVEMAWQRLYELYMAQNYNDKAVLEFDSLFPEFPFRNQLLVDYELAKEEFLPVLTGGKWGYINSNGLVRIEGKYDFAEYFYEGLAVVSKKGKMGYINKRGDEVVPIFFDEAENFHNNFGIVHEGGKTGAVNRNGNMIVPLKYDDMGDFSEDKAAVFIGDLCGYVSSAGDEIIPPRFNICGDFVSNSAICEWNDQYGLIDATGTALIPFEFDLMIDAGNELIEVKKDGLTTLYRRDGRRVLPLIYEEIGDFHEGKAVVILKGKAGYIREDGSLITGLNYDWWQGILSHGNFTEGYAVVMSNQKFGLIDTTGSWMIRPRYSELGIPGGGLISFKKNQKWGFLNPDGKEVIEPRFDQPSVFRDQLAIVLQLGKSGVVNKRGQWVIRPAFQRIEYVGQQLFLVWNQDLIELFDTGENRIIPAGFEKYQIYNKRYLKLTSGNSVTWFDIEQKRILFPN
jgi:hypothetical protein